LTQVGSVCNLNMTMFALLVCGTLLQVNEAISAVSSASSAMEVEFAAIARQKARVKATMTFQHAIKIMESSHGADQKVLNMIRTEIGNAKDQTKNHNSLRKERSASQSIAPPPGSAGNSQSDYNGGVWAALHKINDMLLETVEKEDLEWIRCDSYKRSSEQLMEEIKEDLSTYIVLIASAMSDKNAADAKITTHGNAGDKVEEEIFTFLKEMNTELQSLTTQMKVAQGDAEVMEKILNMTECADKEEGTTLVQTQTEMLQCVNMQTGKQFTKLHIKSAALRRQFKRMKHPKVMLLLKEAGIAVDEVDLTRHQKHHRRHKHHKNSRKHVLALAQEYTEDEQENMDCGCSCHNDTALQVLFGSEQRNNSCNIRDPGTFSFLDNCCIKPDGVLPCCALPTPSPEVSGGSEPTNTFSEPDPEMQAEKCSLKDSSKCPELRERFLNINGGIEDTITQLKHLIESTEFRKTEGHKIMKAELSYHKNVGDSETEKLGRAMAQLSTLQESERMKTSLLTTTKTEYDAEVVKCKTTVDELANEECALGKIRGELLNMDALPNNVTDCMVSKWAEEECSLTCGGGTQLLTRSVEIEAENGYNCPALQARQSCHEERCPLDCELSDWTGWSACSAMCDGGVMDRIRPVVVHPTSGGSPCETSDDSQNCNVQACDKDCVLHEWTEWTAGCTKVCGGGRQMRFKKIKEHEYGEMGTCPTFHDSKRFQWKKCNEHECQFDDRYPMTCESKLDVVLALDASGSMGNAGWAAVKIAAASIAGSMGSGTKISAMAFSSPYWYTEMMVCMGWWPRIWWPWHTDCGVKWIHHMTTDSAAVKTAIEGAEADFRGTLTNAAIDFAAVELQQKGRQYAQSVLVVFTDGWPQSRDRTIESSEKFKEAGRVIYVPVGSFATDDDYFSRIASYPAEDNVVNIADFKTLAARATLNRLLPDFCPNIVQSIPAETSN